METAGDPLLTFSVNGHHSRHPRTGVNHERRTGHSRKVRQKTVSPAGSRGVIIIGADTCCSPGFPRKQRIALVSQYQQHDNRRRRTVVESQHYRDLLRADNERRAAEALRNNQTFIASLPGGLIPITEIIKEGILSLLTGAEGSGQPSTPLRQIKQTGKNSGSVTKLLARINTQHP